MTRRQTWDGQGSDAAKAAQAAAEKAAEQAAAAEAAAEQAKAQASSTYGQAEANNGKLWDKRDLDERSLILAEYAMKS
jgi:hypothetical protein